jgi:hypothetical protein
MLTKFCYHSRDGGIATIVSRTFSPLANRDYHNVGSNCLSAWNAGPVHDQRLSRGCDITNFLRGGRVNQNVGPMKSASCPGEPP